MIDITINTTDVRRINKIVDNITRGMRDAKQPLKESQRMIVEDSKANFAKQGFNFGTAWRPLASSTRSQRARLGYNPARPILVRSGGLREATREGILTKDTATVVNKSRIAVYHQKGGSKIPKRMVLGISDRVQRAIEIVFGNWIKDMIK